MTNDDSTNQSTTQQTTITQDYYDELCIENAEVFDLGEQEAVKETEEQLMQSLSSNNQDLAPGNTPSPRLDHLSRTFPTSPQGVEERHRIQEFQIALKTLVNEKSDAGEKKDSSLKLIRQRIEEEPFLFLSIMEVSNGFDILLKAALGDALINPHKELSLATLRSCLEQVMRQHPRKRDLMICFHKSIDKNSSSVSCLEAMVQTVEDMTSSSFDEWNCSTLEDLLVVLWYAVRNNESHKTTVMGIRTRDKVEAPTLFVTLIDVLSTVEKKDHKDNDNNTDETNDTKVLGLGRALCRLVTCLCTFESDLVVPNHGSTSPPNVSSAHANVMRFHQDALVLKLHHLMQRGPLDPSLLLALRAMAIHDDVVQGIVAVGLLKQVRNILIHTLNCHDNTSDDPTDQNKSVDMLVAIVGLFRNVCANDDVKTSLCLGEDESIVAPLVQAMTTHIQNALLQEHACGTIAAMALRKPKNAQALVNEHQVQVCVVSAMQAHPSRAPLQRQAALALRNLVSRSSELRPALHQAGAEKALLQISAKHAACQDEVYAALRDMGVEGVGMVSVQRDDATGEVVSVKQGPEMFGEAPAGTLNFRPVYD